MIRESWMRGAATLATMGTLGLMAGCGQFDEDTANESEQATPAGEALRATPSRTLSADTRFFVPPASAGSRDQMKALKKAKKSGDAALIAAMEETPRAVWFTDGTPAEVKAAVKKTMEAADCEVPVLVAYNLPFRDCAQYSAGGAVDTAAYEAWIDGFAAGIGKAKAVVILEPDALGIIPYYTSYWASGPDWCQPKVTDATGNQVPAPGATPADRFAQLNYAIDKIHAKAPSALVYLDGTHSGWLGANEAANRLVQGGVRKAEGFFMNLSNYQLTSDSIHFGTWVSSCLAVMKGHADAGDSGWDASWGCPNQYVETPTGSGNYVPDYSPANVAAVDGAYATALGTWVPSTRFLIDTSRNGRGPLDAVQYASAPTNQPAPVISALKSGSWCNPPGAGAGLRPLALPGAALLDAYMWIKPPGESDGSCDIAGGARAWDFAQYNPWSLTGDAQLHFDPLWGMVDPAAGLWFPEQALELAQNAVPPLR
jgi:endoglucanase